MHGSHDIYVDMLNLTPVITVRTAVVISTYDQAQADMLSDYWRVRNAYTQMIFYRQLSSVNGLTISVGLVPSTQSPCCGRTNWVMECWIRQAGKLPVWFPFFMLWACDHSVHGVGESTSALMLADLRLYTFCKSQLWWIAQRGSFLIGISLQVCCCRFWQAIWWIICEEVGSLIPWLEWA